MRSAVGRPAGGVVSRMKRLADGTVRRGDGMKDRRGRVCLVSTGSHEDVPGDGSDDTADGRDISFDRHSGSRQGVVQCLTPANGMRSPTRLRVRVRARVRVPVEAMGSLGLFPRSGRALYTPLGDKDCTMVGSYCRTLYCSCYTLTRRREVSSEAVSSEHP